VYFVFAVVKSLLTIKSSYPDVKSFTQKYATITLQIFSNMLLIIANWL